MLTFVRVTNGTAQECYITKIENGLVYYGHVIPGHENKEATAVMTVAWYNKLIRAAVPGKCYYTGCTHGPYFLTTSHIIGKAVYAN